MRFKLMAVALATLAICPITAQALDCGSGSYIADAQIVAPASMGRVLRSTQFAWDGNNRITHVCNLTGGEARDHEGVWRIYSSEVNREFGGICVMLTGTDGRDRYSCATPGAVARARASARGSREFRLHFGTWQAGLAPNITD